MPPNPLTRSQITKASKHGSETRLAANTLYHPRPPPPSLSLSLSLCLCLCLSRPYAVFSLYSALHRDTKSINLLDPQASTTTKQQSSLRKTLSRLWAIMSRALMKQLRGLTLSLLIKITASSENITVPEFKKRRHASLDSSSCIYIYINI